MSAPARLVPPTGLTVAVAGSFRDLLEHPLPLLAGNVVWGLGTLVALTAWIVSPVAGVVASVLLAWPTLAVAALAARVVRGEAVRLRDAMHWPPFRPAVVVLASLAVLGATVALVDIAAGLERGDLMGVGFATVAIWGLVALAVVACVTWPLLGDPAGGGRGARASVHLALVVILSHTVRVAAASVVVAIALALSAALLAPLLTVSLVLAALLLCRVILPLADELDPAVAPGRA